MCIILANERHGACVAENVASLGEASKLFFAIDRRRDAGTPRRTMPTFGQFFSGKHGGLADQSPTPPVTQPVTPPVVPHFIDRRARHGGSRRASRLRLANFRNEGSELHRMPLIEPMAKGMSYRASHRAR
jgi:hypothetical protein